MNISEFSVRNSIFGNMITLAVFVAGIYTAAHITRELFPLTELDIIAVTTVYRNAAPEEVENHITIPIEDEIRGVDGIDEFVSISSESISRIIITLDPDEEKNKERIIADISRKVDRVKNLPKDVEKPDIEVLTGGNEVIHVSISGNVPEQKLRDTALMIKSRIEDVPGVSRVDKSGWRDPEIWAEINPEKLIENELSILQVADAVGKQNVNMPGGKIQAGTKDTILRTTGEFQSPADVENVVVRSNSDGKHLTVGDIGSARHAFSDDSVIVRANGSRGIILDVRKKITGDTIDISDTVSAMIKTMRTEVDENIELGILDFESYVIKRRLKVLLSNGLAGLILVLCSLPLVLNFRLAMVTGLGIPFAFLVSILIMSWCEMTINMITMFGMILVIGMLVDDAIIVAENVFRHIEMGKTPRQAAIDGTKEVLWPVTATILTTIAAFIPMLGLPGIMGKFLKWVPIIVIITLTASLFEALVILPAHISDFVGGFKPGQKKRSEGKLWTSIQGRYSRLLKLVLRHRFIFIAITVFMLAGSLFLAKQVMYVDQFPADLIEIFSVNISAPEGTSRDVTEERAAHVEKIIEEELADNELQNMITYVGYLRDYDAANVQTGSRYATVFVYLTTPSKRDRSAQEIIASLTDKCTAVDGVSELQFTMVKGGPPVGKAIDIKLVGPDYKVLDKLADDMKAALSQYEGVTDIKDDHDLGKEELRITLNRRNAARLGVSVESVAQTVYSGFEGIPITSIRNSEDETKVRVKLAPPWRDQVEHLLKLKVPNNTGRLIDVGSVAELNKSHATTGIFHFNGDRAVSVTGDVKNKTKNTHAVNSANDGLWEQFKNIGDQYPGYRIARTGEWEDNQEMVSAMINAALAALLMIYTILVIQFKSFLQPFVVLTSIPFGVIGVILALAAHGKPISIMAMMGMVGLMGVVVNDAIVLVSFINDLKREGVPAHEAITRAAETRLRPIILTSVTTILGLAPVIYGIGGYEPFVAPAAIVLAYGLVFSTLLTLLVVPCMYSIGADMKDKFTSRLRRGQSAPASEIE